jgi:hypothetical protein
MKRVTWRDFDDTFGLALGVVWGDEVFGGVAVDFDVYLEAGYLGVLHHCL